jgi:hypothetical protein
MTTALREAESELRRGEPAPLHPLQRLLQESLAVSRLREEEDLTREENSKSKMGAEADGNLLHENMEQVSLLLPLAEMKTENTTGKKLKRGNVQKRPKSASIRRATSRTRARPLSARVHGDSGPSLKQCDIPVEVEDTRHQYIGARSPGNPSSVDVLLDSGRSYVVDRNANPHLFPLSDLQPIQHIMHEEEKYNRKQHFTHLPASFRIADPTGGLVQPNVVESASHIQPVRARSKAKKNQSQAAKGLTHCKANGSQNDPQEPPKRRRKKKKVKKSSRTGEKQKLRGKDTMSLVSSSDDDIPIPNPNPNSYDGPSASLSVSEESSRTQKLTKTDQILEERRQCIAQIQESAHNLTQALQESTIGENASTQMHAIGKWYQRTSPASNSSLPAEIGSQMPRQARQLKLASNHNEEKRRPQPTAVEWQQPDDDDDDDDSSSNSSRSSRSSRRSRHLHHSEAALDDPVGQQLHKPATTILERLDSESKRVEILMTTVLDRIHSYELRVKAGLSESSPRLDKMRHQLQQLRTDFERLQKKRSVMEPLRLPSTVPSSVVSANLTFSPRKTSFFVDDHDNTQDDLGSEESGSDARVPVTATREQEETNDTTQYEEEGTRNSSREKEEEKQKQKQKQKEKEKEKEKMEAEENASGMMRVDVSTSSTDLQKVLQTSSSNPSTPKSRHRPMPTATATATSPSLSSRKVLLSLGVGKAGECGIGFDEAMTADYAVREGVLSIQGSLETVTAWQIPALPLEQGRMLSLQAGEDTSLVLLQMAAPLSIVYAWGTARAENLLGPLPAEGPVSSEERRAHQSRLARMIAQSADPSLPKDCFFCVGSPSPNLETRTMRLSEIALGQEHVVAVNAQGNVFTWGNNSFGQLGVGDFLPRDQPTIVPLPDRQSHVAAGDFFSLSHSGRPSEVYAWGCGQQGCLGDGDDKNGNLPGKIKAFHNKVVKLLVAGAEHAAAVISQDMERPISRDLLFLWGSDAFGQLGRGSQRTGGRAVLPSFVYVPEKSAIERVSLGWAHSALVTASGQVYTCGYNHYGQLGNGNYKNSGKFAPLNLPELVGNVACGMGHTLFLTVTGKLWGCGRSMEGQLGFQSQIGRTIPIEIVGENQNEEEPSLIVDAIAAGASHSLVAAHYAF